MAVSYNRRFLSLIKLNFMKVFQAMDGFLWADVTPMAKELWNNGVFDMFIINDDDTESQIESSEELIEALSGNSIIAIELCFLHEITPLN